MITIFEERLDNITGDMKAKARVVARGDLTDLKKKKDKASRQEMYAPVVSIVMVRLMLSIVAALNLKMGQNDIKRAFLYSRRDTPNFLHLPEGHPKKNGKSKVWKTYGVTYGLLDNSMESDD